MQHSCLGEKLSRDRLHNYYWGKIQGSQEVARALLCALDLPEDATLDQVDLDKRNFRCTCEHPDQRQPQTFLKMVRLTLIDGAAVCMTFVAGRACLLRTLLV